jgi:S-adenosylmethionine:tRNA ribosyltransferase-isomerase
MNAPLNVLDFTLPKSLEATAPPEARGLRRDQVRLLVSYINNNRLEHRHFYDLPDVLEEGDVVVINTSGTLNAALAATTFDGKPFEIHLSTEVPHNDPYRPIAMCAHCDNPYAAEWVIEVREPNHQSTKPYYTAQVSEQYHLPGGGMVWLKQPYSRLHNGGNRLWVATLELPLPLFDYLAQYGVPIRYSYVPTGWGTEFYQTVYATTPGSAEMPSAGRGFTPELMTRLVAKGVQIVPLLLHTGVASLEDHEPPYAEYYRVPEVTTSAINIAHQAGRRVIAVGTTVVRALESVTDGKGTVHAGEGWTELVITPERGVRAIDGLLTGMHEPKATHLAMLEALAGRNHLVVAYQAALDEGYLWHEFGDLHLILP